MVIQQMRQLHKTTIIMTFVIPWTSFSSLLTPTLKLSPHTTQNKKSWGTKIASVHKMQQKITLNNKLLEWCRPSQCIINTCIT